jgi:hypothetical protein
MRTIGRIAKCLLHPFDIHVKEVYTWSVHLEDRDEGFDFGFETADAEYP